MSVERAKAVTAGPTWAVMSLMPHLPRVTPTEAPHTRPLRAMGRLIRSTTRAHRGTLVPASSVLSAGQPPTDGTVLVAAERRPLSCRRVTPWHVLCRRLVTPTRQVGHREVGGSYGRGMGRACGTGLGRSWGRRHRQGRETVASSRTSRLPGRRIRGVVARSAPMMTVTVQRTMTGWRA